jgi:hypothetical protein
MRSLTVRRSAFSSLVLVVSCASLAAAQGKVSPCADRGSSDRPNHCEVREFEVPVSGTTLTVDASPNGGISVRGWAQNAIQVKATVQAQGDSQQAADDTAAGVRVTAQGGRIHAEGPATGHGNGWSVSFEVMVPAGHGLNLSTTNGGVAVRDLNAHVEFATTNGGVTLANVNGNVRGRTNNGGIRVQLSGDAWQGAGLDVETHNGGVQVIAPDAYSAHLDVATTNGGLRCDFPVTAQGNVGKALSADLGRGGPTVKLRTVNGGVSVTRQR